MWPEDKDLEHIFKEGSNKYEYPYDPVAWQQMETLLNRQRRRKFLFWIFGIGLFLIIAGTAYNWNNSPTAANNHTDVDVPSLFNNTNSVAIKDNETITSNKTESAQPNSNTAKTVTSENEKSDIANVTTVKGTDEKAIIEIGETPLSNTENNNIADNRDIRDALNNTLNTSQTNIMVNQESTSSQASSILSKESALEIVRKEDVLRNEGIEQLQSLQLLSIIPFQRRPYEIVLPSMVKMKDVTEITTRRFILSGFIGAESSWTPNGEYSSIDLSVGIKTAYLLTDKLAVSLGANLRSDSYIAGRDDYIPEQGFWENGIAPDYTTADCSMMEISSGLSYAFNGADNTGIVLSGLLVSNFMLKESYDYHFEDQARDFSSEWVGSNSTLFSNLELGLGYRRQLRRGQSLEVTPYAKLPINGIGHGKLMLSSFGLRMSYNLGL